MRDFPAAKVPAVTLTFWVLKILATTLGETAGDTLSMTLNLGYLAATAIFAAVLVRASAFWSAASTASGTASRRGRTGRAVSMNRRAIIAWAVGAANGVSPASISYSTTASE